MTVADGTAVVIQLFLYFFTQLFNILTDVGLMVDSWKAPKLCQEVLDSVETTNQNGTKASVNCSSGANFTSSALKGAQSDALRMSFVILVFTAIGAVFFIAQLVMYSKYLKAVKRIDFEHIVDSSKFLKHFYVIHGLVLFAEAVLHDLAMGFVVVELCALVWKEPNCWECETLVSGETPQELSITKMNLWLGTKLVSIVPVSLYKGMLPVFMWIGGPFCGMDCYICRVCVVVPVGLLVSILLMTPVCAAILYRLVPLASDGLSKGAPNTVWSIGLIFWGLTLVVVTILCSFCVPCCRTCCFKYGVCRCCGLDCCGLGGPKKKETIKAQAD